MKLSRYPFIRQNDGSDCGCAALAMVARYHGLAVGLEQLRELTGTDRIGSNLLGLARAAENLGFTAKGVHGPYEGLRQVALPAVAHVKTDQGEGHFVVLYRVDRQGVTVGDPAKFGVAKLSADEFRKKWSGNLLLLTPEPHRTPTVKVRKPIGPWRRLWRLLWAERSLLAEAFCCALLMTALGLATSFFIQQLLDNVLVLGQWRLLHGLGIGMIVVLVFTVLFGILRQYLLAFISRRVDLSLVGGFLRHVLHLPLSFFEMRRTGEIISRALDAQKVREAISGTALTALVDGTLVVVSLIVLWIYDVPLALVATLFVPVLVISVFLHQPAAQLTTRTALEQSAGLSAHMVEDVSGSETIKAFGLERHRSEEGELHLARAVSAVFHLQGINISMTALTTIVASAASLVVLWYGGVRVMSGLLTIGELMFFYSILTRLLEPLKNLASVNLQLQEAAVAVDRLYQVLDVGQEPLGAAGKIPFRRLERAIELDDVTFRYGHRDNVLEELTLTIPAGKTVAIVGESGSGKSTLLKLLMGFYFPSEGRVSIDGVDSRDIEQQSLRSRIGVVAQDPFIFTGTIRENVCLGKTDAGMDEIAEAVRLAGLEAFIAGLPQRYSTVIGERGANLSGGQRQRLAIARALIRKPDILIFDEATSHLDTATEHAIQVSLERQLRGRTADVIYVLHEGRLRESGTHDELLAQQGWYAALWNSQAGGDPEALLAVGNGEQRTKALGGRN
jgi:ATP-binding cassette subfamily B protein